MGEKSEETAPGQPINTVVEAFQALRAARKKIDEAGGIRKTTKGQHGKHADLAEELRIIEDPLGDAAIHKMEWVETKANGFTYVGVMLIHENGFQFPKSEVKIPTIENSREPNQDLGKSITYLRRYLLEVALGIRPGDGDNDGRIGEPQTDTMNPKTTTPGRSSKKNWGRDRPVTVSLGPKGNAIIEKAGLAVKSFCIADVPSEALPHLCHTMQWAKDKDGAIRAVYEELLQEYNRRTKEGQSSVMDDFEEVPHPAHSDDVPF